MKFGINQLALFTEQTGVDLGEVTFGLVHLRAMFWSALVEGARMRGESFNHSVFEVGDWIDDMEQSEFDRVMRAVTNSIPDASSKKKRPASKSRTTGKS